MTWSDRRATVALRLLPVLLLSGLLSGCGLDVPTDPDGTLERVRSEGTLRVGASPRPGWVELTGGADPRGREPDLVTAFADDLLDGIKTLDGWPEKVRLMQDNWIGKSQGLKFQFDFTDGKTVDIFTTRPDTLFGASFVALSPDHPVSAELAAKNAEAAAHPDLATLELPVDTTSVELTESAGGGLTATDSGSGGAVFEAPKPLM